MDLEDLQKQWHEFGSVDPLWAILSDPVKTNRRWDLDEFLRTGEKHVADVMNYVESTGIRLRRRSALDFGCGVGRLTQPFCKYFEACVGVDIAPSMVDLARKLNQHGGRCQYVLNARPDLRIFSDGGFDLVYTYLVLQHIRPDYVRGYLQEFVRILARDGVLLFQLPTRPLTRTGGMGSPDAVAQMALLSSPFRARIYAAVGRLDADAGAEVSITVEVYNASEVQWPASSEGSQNVLNVGNHWFDTTGAMLVHDDGRAPLGRALKAGESVQVTLKVNTPSIGGDYLLEIDVVQEMVTWFASCGSPTLRIPVHVAGPAAAHGASVGYIPNLPQSNPDPRTEPAMEIHGIPRAEVLQTVEAAGGRLVDVRQDRSCPGWESYSYCVTR